MEKKFIKKLALIALGIAGLATFQPDLSAYGLRGCCNRGDSSWSYPSSYYYYPRYSYYYPSYSYRSSYSYYPYAYSRPWFGLGFYW